MVGLTGRGRCLTISSALWIQYTNVTDGGGANDHGGPSTGDEENSGGLQTAAVDNSGRLAADDEEDGSSDADGRCDIAIMPHTNFT